MMTKKEEIDEMDGWLRSRGLFMYVRIATYLPACLPGGCLKSLSVDYMPRCSYPVSVCVCVCGCLAHSV